MPRSRPTDPTPAVPRKAPGSYHHGDLREAMLAAAGRVVDDEGIDRLTLRECARRAGVSHSAPAHHFGDLRGLLTELTARGFDGLSAEMDRHDLLAPQDDGFARLLAASHAYVGYATSHRGHFQLMFRSDWADWSQPRLQQAAGAAHRRLQARVAGLPGAGDLQPNERAARVALVWTLVHGLATLALEGHLRNEHGIPAAPQPAQMLDVMMGLVRPGLTTARAA